MTGQCSGDRESELSYSGTPSEYTLWDRLLEGGRRLRFCIRISYFSSDDAEGILVTTSSVRVDLLVELMYFHAFFA